MSQLYHREIGFPQVELPCGTLELQYTAHARRAAQTDRYGYICLSKRVTIRPEQVFEIEVEGQRVTKLCARLPYDERCDLCLVLRGNLCVTCWLNRRDDRHHTLNRGRYARPN